MAKVPRIRKGLDLGPKESKNKTNAHGYHDKMMTMYNTVMVVRRHRRDVENGKHQAEVQCPMHWDALGCTGMQQALLEPALTA